VCVCVWGGEGGRGWLAESDPRSCDRRVA